MSGALSLLAYLSMVATAGEPPPPRVGDPPPIEGPIEGPARPPEPSEPAPVVPEEQPAAEPSSSAIILPPPPDEAAEPIETSPAADGTGWWPDPGSAPSDGSGYFVAGGVLVPTAVFVTWALLREPTLSQVDRTGIIVAGAGMEAIALAGIGLGIHRRSKLARWARGYRVVPTPQGGGLLAAGGIGLTAGLTLVPLGSVILASGTQWVGGVMLAVGGVSLGLSPLLIALGRQRRQAYLETGGWFRRPLPPVSLAPRLLVTPAGIGLAVAGRF